MFRARVFFALLAVSSVSAQTTISAVLPNGRQIHPQGGWISLAPFPFALAIRPDGAQIAIPSIGFPFALNVVNAPSEPTPTVRRMPTGDHNDPAIEVHAGLVYSRSGELLYVATGDSGKVRAYSTSDWKTVATISLDGPVGGQQFSNSFAATLVSSKDGKFLFVLDQGNWRVVVVDTSSMKCVASVPTGAYPFGIALAPDGRRLYVTNSGLFEYKLIPGLDANHLVESGLHFPPFGYPSTEARNGAEVEGRPIPGLGDENSDRGSSLWTYDIADPTQPSVSARLRLGHKIVDASGGTVGGAAPTGVAADSEAVYVTLAHEDAVAKVSIDGSRLLGDAELTPFTGPHFVDGKGRPLRGVMPSGIAVRDDRVYVAESGINAIAVLDAASMTVLEHIPVGWNPTSLDLSPDGKILYVVNAKGRGTGPDGGSHYDPSKPSYIGSLEYGSLSVISLASLPESASLTASAIAGNTAAIDGRARLPRLKHCFLVIRENRTYDEVLGDVAGANGDESLARYGMDGWAGERDPEDRSRRVFTYAEHLRVTPNLHALAARFAMSDNFYVDSDVSADGHRWVLGIQPTPYFNTAWSSGYGGRRHGSPISPEPGRRAMFGGADAPMPEDEPQFGSLWEHIAYARGSAGILNYGEGLELEGNDEMDGAAPEGQRLLLNSPLPRPVFESTDRRYPTFNLGIPDQFRATEFERDFTRRLASGKIPSLIVIRLPNDHTAKPRPADGYPFRASYVADNDLALGQIIAFLSRTPIWKDSALFVTEDDAQDGVDHVDAHRSVLMVASPWVKPGSVSHEHSSMGSITRTILELLDLPPMNLEDALAGEIGGIFDTQPHLAPYVAAPADPRVFDPAQARFAKPKTKQEAAALRDVDNATEIRKEMESSRATLTRPHPHN